MNDYLCDEIDKARGVDKEKEQSTASHELPVLVGYDFKLEGDEISRVRIDRYLEHCLPESSQGHAVGYVDWDGIVRSIPMHLGTSSLESLSLTIARNLDKDVKGPDNGILQFMKPANDFEPIMWNNLWKNYLAGDQKTIESDQAKLQDRFILVGSSEEDKFQTPFGIKSGVVIHAYAVYSLKQNRFIKREAWWISLSMIALLCYLLMVMTWLEFRTLNLILISGGFCLVIVAMSALAMYYWLTWIDLIYPLLAIWLFLFVLISIRKVRRRYVKQPLAES